jgi:putative oxidoreductase
LQKPALTAADENFGSFLDSCFASRIKATPFARRESHTKATSSKDKSMKAPFLIGRILFGGFFLYNGINHLQKARDMAPYAESKGIPAPELAVKLSAVPLIFGGASLLLGVKPKLGALAILGFLAGVSPIMHDFWRMENPDERMKNMIDFMKNAALAGGALALMGVDEPWEASVPVEQMNIRQPKLARKIRKLGRKLAA